MQVSLDDQGIPLACAALRRGDPIVLPPPSPITYGLAGTDPRRINNAKGRPADQPVGIGVTSLATIVEYLPVAAPVLATIQRLIFDELVTVLVTTTDHRPDWLAPATVDGRTLIAGAWLPDTMPIITSVEHLYLSSGNRTSQSPRASAAEADREFDGRLIVVDGDHLRTPAVDHGATTTVSVDPTGAMAIVRSGIQDRAFGAEPALYLDQLQQQAAAPLDHDREGTA